jgi:hypothetical protein
VSADHAYAANLIVAGAAGSTGAFVGYNASGGGITYAYYDADLSGALPGVGHNLGSAQIVALSGGAEYQAGNYTDFNFSTIWTVAASGDLPSLLNAPPP